MNIKLVTIFFGFIVFSNHLLASPVCEAFYQVERSETVFRNEFEKVDFSPSKFAYSGFTALPKLVGDYVKIEYSLKDSMEIQRMRGTVIRQFNGKIEVVDSKGFTHTLSSNLSGLSVRRLKNPGEPMDFRKVEKGRHGLEMLPGQVSHEGNEIVIVSGGKKTHGFIVVSNPGRVIVYSPSESSPGKEVFVEARLEYSLFENAFLRTPTRANIPPLNRLFIIYSLQEARKNLEFLAEEYALSIKERDPVELQEQYARDLESAQREVRSLQEDLNRF